eukprot:PhF_6_TR37502/c1_g1_i5/m.55383
MNTYLRVTAKVKDTREVWPPNETNGTSFEPVMTDDKKFVGITAKVVRPTNKTKPLPTTINEDYLPSSRTYKVDEGFDPKSTQFDLYKTVGIHVVSEIIKGDKIATLITYGAEGTGKSHTMFGVPALKDETRGLIIRIVDSIFTRSAKVDAGVAVTVNVSVVEITHNDEVVDMLVGFRPEAGMTVAQGQISSELPYDWGQLLAASSPTTAWKCNSANDVVKILAAALANTSTSNATSFLQRKADRVVVLEMIKPGVRSSFLLAVDSSPLYCKSMHTLKDIVALLSQSKGSTPSLANAPFQKSKLAQLLRQDLMPGSNHLTRLILHVRASNVDLDNFDCHSVMNVGVSWKALRSIEAAMIPESGAGGGAAGAAGLRFKVALPTTNTTPTPSNVVPTSATRPTNVHVNPTSSLLKTSSSGGSPTTSTTNLAAVTTSNHHAVTSSTRNSGGDTTPRVATKMTEDEAKTFLEEESVPAVVVPQPISITSPLKRNNSSNFSSNTRGSGGGTGPGAAGGATVVEGENMVFDLSESSSDDEVPTTVKLTSSMDHHDELSSNESETPDTTAIASPSIKHKLLEKKYKKLKENCKRYSAMYKYAKEQWDGVLERLEESNRKNQELVQKNILLTTRYEDAKKHLKQARQENSTIDKERLIQQQNDYLRQMQRQPSLYVHISAEYEKLLNDLRSGGNEIDGLRSNLRAMMQIVEKTGEENTHLTELTTKLNKRLTEAHHRLEEYELNEQEYMTREEQYIEEITSLQRQLAILTRR